MYFKSINQNMFVCLYILSVSFKLVLTDIKKKLCKLFEATKYTDSNIIYYTNLFCNKQTLKVGKLRKKSTWTNFKMM